MSMRIARGCALAAFFGLMANVAMAQSNRGVVNRPLETTYWRAIEVAGKPTPSRNANREAHLVFQAGGRVSGSDGCNRIMGRYELKGEGITFSETSATLMACADAGNTEREFRAALMGARRWRIAGDRLEINDATGARLVAFEARSQASRPAVPRH